MRRVLLAFSILACSWPLTARAQEPAPLPERAPSSAASTQSALPTTKPQSDAASEGYVVPHVAPYEGGKIPDNAHIEERTNMGLVTAGAISGGTFYGISLIYALSTCGAQMECRSGSGWLYLPVLGPFITAMYAPTTGGAALSIFDGGVQALGAGLVFAGMIAPKKFVVWQDEKVAIRVAPAPVAGGAGVALSLTHF